MKCSLFCLVLQFDGSLRRPRDPGFPTDDLGRLASAGAAILSSNTQSVLALGGKPLAVTPFESTSAHVEYDGLLMGLQWLVDQDQAWFDERCFGQNEKHQGRVTIQGDCRTVIDQLNGLSVPRKLRLKYNEALDLVEILEERTGSRVVCERISRKENTLCDAICGGVIETLQLKTFLDLQDAILKSAKLPLPFSKKKQQIMRSSSPITNTLVEHVDEGSSHVRHSVRPCLYRQMASVAVAVDDPMAMKTVGEVLENEAKLWPSITGDHKVRRQEHKELLIAEGVRLQIRGLKAMGLVVESQRLERKYRYVLGNFGIADTDSLMTETNSQSLLDLTMSPYRLHLKSLADVGHGPLVSSWHALALQEVLGNVSNTNESFCHENVGSKFEFWVES